MKNRLFNSFYNKGLNQCLKQTNNVYFMVVANHQLAATCLEQLERCQNRALRVITGQLQTTPVEKLRREAGVCSMTTLMSRQTAISYEKAARLTPDHPRRRLLNSPVRHRLV